MSDPRAVAVKLSALGDSLCAAERDLRHGPSERLQELPETITRLCSEVTRLSGEERSAALDRLVALSEQLERLDRIARGRLAEVKAGLASAERSGG